MELIRFIFSSVYTFLGTVILLSLVLQGIAGIVEAFRRDYLNR